MFLRFPHLAAKIYDHFLNIKPIQIQHEQIAQDLLSRIQSGRLLDVGTGPGRLLFEINKRCSDIELFGLDISAAMVQQARKNLSGIKVDLHSGNIQKTRYRNSFFDAVTCTGSFYLWDHPEESLEEIYRILKDGASAFLFEVYRDFNREEFKKGLKANLREVNIFRKIFGPMAIRKAIRMSYRIREVQEIIERTSFAESHVIDKITLSRLPIWIRITLTKKVI